ncbi:hypothetical protein ANO11243_014050 [Dothideomycetidae sp. 11243]|nr:hypothetical protein ANO11243_014050 [fungal sp. No.11243]
MHADDTRPGQEEDEKQDEGEDEDEDEAGRSARGGTHPGHTDPVQTEGRTNQSRGRGKAAVR